MFPEVRQHGNYTEVGGIRIYTPLYQLLLPLIGVLLRNVIVSRWSREGDDANASEQLIKTLASHRADVAAVDALLASVPDDAWNSPSGRQAHGIFEICIRDVTPYRYDDDPNGKRVIGYAIVVGDTLVFRVSSSGYKTINRDDGEQLNPYSQSVIELMKFATAFAGGTGPICLRLSDDRKRKGRHLAELARIDTWIDRLRVRVFYGSQELDRAGFGTLMESFTNFDAAKNRGDTVENLTKGVLASTQKGYIPASILNLPPFLRHVIDPNAVGFDPRLREGPHLVVEWDVSVFPALWDYVTAFADGAGRSELVAILRRHKVPTPRQLPPAGSRVRYSPLRDTTFDQLELEEASVRASRWLTYSDHRFKPVPSDAPLIQRSKQELSNHLALRKILMLQTGQFLYTYSNPTETSDSYGDFEVTRSGPLDPGVIKAIVTMAWPEKRKVVTGADGMTVVTEELELDENGNPIPWEYCGCDPHVLEQCIRRIQRTGVEGSTRKHDSPATRGMVRLLDINRWTTIDADGSARQWEMWCRGNATNGSKRSSVGHWRTRWLLWRPAPDPTDPASGLNFRWKAEHTDAARKHPVNPGRHLATIREGLLVASVADAARTAVLAALDSDEPLSVSSIGAQSAASERASQARQLLEQAERAVEAAAKARASAAGYEDAAMEARSIGDTVEQQRLLARVADKRREAAELDEHADRLRAEADDLTDVDEAEISVTTVAHLLELLRRSAEQFDGYVPASVAPLLARCFTDWEIDPGDGASCSWRCTARLRLVDGRTVALPLAGMVPNTAYGHGAKDPYARLLIGRLSDGATLDEVAAEGVATRTTTRESLYIKAVKYLGTLGVSPELAGPLLDHPHPALRVVVSALGGQRPAGYTWGPGFERHMKSTYCDPQARWASAASPTKHSRDILAVFAVVQQHPAGVLVTDITTAAGVSAQLVERLVTPWTASSSRGWPKMLEWADGQTGRAVRAIPCPHADCRGIDAHATVAVFLPETAPEERGIGGVLCPTCSRLPRADYADVVFPAEWHRPACSAADGRHAARQARVTHVVEMPSVPTVSAAPVVYRLQHLADEFRIGRAKVKEIVHAAGVEPCRERGPGGGKLLYPQEAYDVMTTWRLTKDPEEKGAAVRLSVLTWEFGLSRRTVSEALAAAGVTPLLQTARGRGGGALYPAAEARAAVDRFVAT